MTDIEYTKVDEVLGEMLEYLDEQDFTQEQSKEFQKVMIITVRVILRRLKAIEQSL